MVADFELEEIKEAVWDYEGDKSPGPYGFSFKFLKTLWELLKCDFKKVLDDFH